MLESAPRPESEPAAATAAAPRRADAGALNGAAASPSGERPSATAQARTATAPAWTDRLAAVLRRSCRARPAANPLLATSSAPAARGRLLQRFNAANVHNGTLTTAPEIAEVAAGQAAYAEAVAIGNQHTVRTQAIIDLRQFFGHYVAHPHDQAIDLGLLAKCFAVGGPPGGRVVAMSGWSHAATAFPVPLPGNAGYIAAVQAGAAGTNAVLTETAAMELFGYARTLAGAWDGGTPGRYHASHAERQVALAQPAHPIGVRWLVCGDCLTWFRWYSGINARVHVVVDPNWVHRFDNGSHWRRPRTAAGAGGFVRM